MTDRSEIEWAVVAALLRKEGATHIVIAYDGSGDSGEYTSIIATRTEPEEDGGAWSASDSIELDATTREQLEHWADDKVLKNIDWYNNDGGFGQITVDLLTLKAVHVCHIREMSHSTDRYEVDFGG